MKKYEQPLAKERSIKFLNESSASLGSQIEFEARQISRGFTNHHAAVDYSTQSQPDAPAMTMDEVGQEFYVTRQRIRQIEARAFRRIRFMMQTSLIAFETAQFSEEQLEPYRQLLEWWGDNRC